MTVITISRQFGSGGDDIALNLCKELGYQFFDKNMVLEAAKTSGLSSQEIVDYSEDNYKVRSFLDRLFGNTPILPYAGIWPDDLAVMYGLEELKLSENDSLHLVQQAIQMAYQVGNMVIVGRGGQILLKDHPGVLHLRIIAPLQDRIQRVQKKLEEVKSPGRAADIIQQRDLASAEYIKRFYHQDLADPLLYHLVINMGKLSIDQVVQRILDLVLSFEPNKEQTS